VSRDAIVAAVAAELRALAGDNAPPEAALARMRQLAAGAGATVQLTFTREPYGDGFAYDAVVDEGDGALVLRFCAERGLPLLLHAAERLQDRELLRVDGQTLLVRDAVALLDFVWSERPLMRRLVDVCLIQAELARTPVELDDAMVQDALDRLRATHGLHDAEATHRWMAERSMTHEALERYAGDQAAILALRERLVGGEVAAHLAANARDYDRAVVARLRLPADTRGRSFAEEAATAQLDVTTAAATWLARSDGGGALPLVEELRRGALSPVLRAAVFDEPPGALRVARDGETLTLLHVYSVVAAALDEPTRERVADDLFGAWLAARRATARIEWNWGQAARTRID
jgi:putative peptide maturation system protein